MLVYRKPADIIADIAYKIADITNPADTPIIPIPIVKLLNLAWTIKSIKKPTAHSIVEKVNNLPITNLRTCLN